MRKIGPTLALAACAAAHAAGPDLVISDVTAVTRWGSRDGFVAYSAGTMVCNLGDQIHEWDRFTPHHPVIAQNLLRVKDGRLEHIGVSWVKHAFSADVASVCATCQIPPGYNGQQLGVGCADAYSAAINGEIWTLGPRSQVAASTGVFPYPVNLAGYPAATPTIGRRVQVALADVDPAQNPGARYFAETQFIALQEAAAGNGGNSVTYREFSVAANLDWAPTPAATSRRATPAIYAWAEVYPDVRLTELTIPSEGSRLVLASRAVDLGDGRWRYLYALQNVTSDLAIGRIEVPVPSCIAASDAAMRLPMYHSGEPWSNAAWLAARESSAMVWHTPETHAVNTNSSAVRWGSIASFELIAAAPPVSGRVALGTFAASPEGTLLAAAFVPGGSADINGDGFLDFFDYDDFVVAYESGAAAADFNGDGFLDLFDYDAFVSSFEQGCL